MTKGLEALKRITLKDFILNDDSSLNDIKIIEKELKQRENLATMCDELAELVGLKDKDYLELKEIIKNKLKALEIIKEKKVFVANLIYHFEYDDNVINYNRCCGWSKSELTQQEYDLLKEVLYATH